jgi:hypothetical protein
MALVLPDHFLQKNDVRAKASQTVAQLVHRHAALEMGKPLMDVIRGDMQLVEHVKTEGLGRKIPRRLLMIRRANNITVIPAEAGIQWRSKHAVCWLGTGFRVKPGMTRFMVFWPDQ